MFLIVPPEFQLALQHGRYRYQPERKHHRPANHFTAFFLSENDGRLVGTRTPDLYRVNLATLHPTLSTILPKCFPLGREVHMGFDRVAHLENPSLDS
jgi:hypothetical protein